MTSQDEVARSDHYSDEMVHDQSHASPVRHHRRVFHWLAAGRHTGQAYLRVHDYMVQHAVEGVDVGELVEGCGIQTLWLVIEE